MLTLFFSYVSIFLTAILSIFASSGILRTYLHISWSLSLVISLLAFLISYAVLKSKISLPKVTKKQVVILILIELILFGFYIYKNDFGIATIGNSDSGLHLRFLKAFEKSKYEIYHGFINFYSVSICLRSLFSLNFYDTFIVTTYLWFFLIIAIVYLSSSIIINTENKNEFLLVLLTILAGFCFYFPLYFEFIIQGAFVHASGILTLLLAAVIYAIPKNHIYRILGLLIGVFALRHSYGLNIGDIVLTSAIVLLFDKPAKVNQNICTVILIILSFFSYYTIWSIINKNGVFTKTHIYFIWLGLTTGAFSFISFIKDNKKLSIKKSSLSRLLLYTSVISIITVLAQIFYLLAGARFKYYDLKYPIYASFLCISVSTGLLFLLLSSKKYFSKITFGLLVSLMFFVYGYSPYYKDVYKRRLRSLVNKSEYYAIEEILKAKEKKFGGYISGFWATYKFMNTSFGGYNSYKTFKNGKIKYEPGYCIFWPGGLEAYEHLKAVMNHKQKGSTHRVIDHIRFERTHDKNFKALNIERVVDSKLQYYCK